MWFSILLIPYPATDSNGVSSIRSTVCSRYKGKPSKDRQGVFEGCAGVCTSIYNYDKCYCIVKLF